MKELHSLCKELFVREYYDGLTRDVIVKIDVETYTKNSIRAKLVAVLTSDDELVRSNIENRANIVATFVREIVII